MKRIALAVFGAISLSACAQAPQPGVQASSARAAAVAPPAPAAPAAPAAPIAGTPDARATAAVAVLNPRVKVERVGAAPIPGFREAIVAGQAVYVSDDGKYLFLPGAGGALFDVQARRNLSEAAMASVRRELLKAIPVSERIVFSPPNPKYTVTVFTDVECGYCRKLHSEIGEYNRQGIAVQYLAFPRMGVGSEDFKTMVSVWCASDRKAAMTAAKSTGRVSRRDCNNTVRQQYDIGQRAGLSGTPMILTADGTQLGGYLSPSQLRETLDRLASDPGAVAAAPGA